MTMKEVDEYRAKLLQVKNLATELSSKALKHLKLDPAKYTEEEIAAALADARTIANGVTIKYGQAAEMLAHLMSDPSGEESYDVGVPRPTGSVDKAAEQLLKPDVEDGYARFLSAVLGYISSGVWESANLGCRSTDESEYYVLVPSGLDTCAFCLMVASNGPQQLGNKNGRYSANSYFSTLHDNCDCVVMRASDSRLDEYYDTMLPQLKDMYENAYDLSSDRYAEVVDMDVSKWQQLPSNRGAYGRYKSANYATAKQMLLSAYRELYGLK